jgi:hypothetical protein
MKKSIFTLLLVLGFTLTNAQNYEGGMKETILLYDSVKTMSDYQNIVNRFERIATAESKKWLPKYYAGLTYVFMSFVKGLDSDKRDEYLDLAMVQVEAAKELSANNSELMVLEGYVKMAKVSISPAVRGVYMSGQVSSTFAKALELNPSNPRANLMNGRWKIGMAQFFGSSTEEACGFIQKSMALFEAEEDDTIQPHWGIGQARAMVRKCSQE